MNIVFAPKFPFVFRADASYVERMPVGQREGLFAVLDQMDRSRPGWLPLLRLEGWDDVLCLYDFRSKEFGKYAGMELVFLEPRRVMYHRLPGALPDGAGNVPAGEYRLRLRPFDGPRTLGLRLLKSERGRIDEIVHVKDSFGDGPAVEIPGRMFAYSMFATELLAQQSEWLRRLGSVEASGSERAQRGVNA